MPRKNRRERYASAPGAVARAGAVKEGTDLLKTRAGALGKKHDAYVVRKRALLALALTATHSLSKARRHRAKCQPYTSRRDVCKFTLIRGH